LIFLYGQTGYLNDMTDEGLKTLRGITSSTNFNSVCILTGVYWSLLVFPAVDPSRYLRLH